MALATWFCVLLVEHACLHVDRNVALLSSHMCTCLAASHIEQLECRCTVVCHEIQRFESCHCVLLVVVLAAAPNEDAVAQHRHAKELLQLTEWMAAVGQGDKDMLVRLSGTSR